MALFGLIPHWSEFLAEERAADITTPVAGPGVSVTQQITQSWFDEIRSGSPSISGTAAVVSATDLTRRAFMVAQIMPQNRRTALLTPGLMAMIAGRCLLYGNSVTEMFTSQRGGGMELIPVPTFEVGGSIPRVTWTYNLKWRNQDNDEIEKQVAGDRVLHVRYMEDAEQPWYGRGPLQRAGVSSEQLAYIERSLSHDARTPVAHILPLPDAASVTQRQGIAEGIRNARGQVTVPETAMAGFGQGPAAAPQRDMVTSRVGPDMPSAAIELREKTSAWVSQALGVNPAMFGPNGGAQREAVRHYYHFTLLAIARLIEAELREKLDIPSLRVSLEDLQAVDVSARSRAVVSLAPVIGPRPALDLVGWKNVPVEAPEPPAEPEEEPDDE